MRLYKKNEIVFYKEKPVNSEKLVFLSSVKHKKRIIW